MKRGGVIRDAGAGDISERQCMTDQHIFEDNRRTINGKKLRGATWRFRHKILQDYFAKMATEPPKP